MTNGIKKVSDAEFDKAYNEMCEALEVQTGYDGRWGAIQFFFSADPNDDTAENPWNRREIMQVNWAAIGTVTPVEAAEFGRALIVAAQLAQGFIYNGYKVSYED